MLDRLKISSALAREGYVKNAIVYGDARRVFAHAEEPRRAPASRCCSSTIRPSRSASSSSSSRILRGLRARGKLIPEVARARELFALVQSRAVDGLSIGFRNVKGRIDPASRVRKIIDLDL